MQPKTLVDVIKEQESGKNGVRATQRAQCTQENTENTENLEEDSALTALSALHVQVQQAITKTLPLADAGYIRAIFAFARHLKAIQGLADASNGVLRPYIQEWHRQAVTGERKAEEVWIDFMKAWPKVKYPIGTGPLHDMLARAKSHPLPPEASRYEQPALLLLIGLCRELQRAAGEATWFLAGRPAAEVLKVDSATAYRWLFLLEQDGLLRCVTRGSRETRKANEYRYTGQIVTNDQEPKGSDQ